MPKRKSVPIDVVRLVLHEAGYMCANPSCRHVITLDIHHLIQVAESGSNLADNLLAMCPNCHALHHRGEIPHESIRAWKMLSLAMNEAFDRRMINVLLLLNEVKSLRLSGDGVLAVGPLVVSRLVQIKEPEFQGYFPTISSSYFMPTLAETICSGKTTEQVRQEREIAFAQIQQSAPVHYEAELTSNGKMFVDCWRRGDQRAAIELSVLVTSNG